jgi:hypothetical protein
MNITNVTIMTKVVKEINLYVGQHIYESISK